MKRVVKYDNYMNELRFSDFTQVDLDFFMTLCSLMKGQDTNELSFTFHELRKMTGYTKSNSVKKFAEDLEQMNEHLMKVNCKLKTETRTIMFVLFPTFDIDIENQVLKVSVNPKFQFLLNEITKNFTKFELNEFLSLSSKYSKNLYRLLKQFKATGIYKVSIHDFREKIGCPDTYASKYIMDKIIKPSINELNSKAYFQGLKCTPQYENKRGRPLKGYVFVFEPEKADRKVLNSHNKNQKADVNCKSKRKKPADPQNREYDYEELEKELLRIDMARGVIDTEEEDTDNKYSSGYSNLYKLLMDNDEPL